MRLPKDLREFIESLNSHQVEYVVVGAHALAFHGYPRYTGDIDLLVRVSPENAVRLEKVICDFSFASAGLVAQDFLQADQVIQLGRPPNRIDVLTSLTGVQFDEIWASRVAGALGGLPVAFISKELFIKNKRATGRTKDVADVEGLGNE